MGIFKSRQKKFKGDLKVRLCGKRLYPTEGVKYFGVKTDPNLNWLCQVNDLSVKLIRANALLFKIRKYVSPKIFSNPTYCSLVWGQNFRTIQRILILQKKVD